MITLGIETSCDDTSLALMQDSKIVDVLSFSQGDFFSNWGGVIPELAARNHLSKLGFLLPKLFSNIKIEDIDLIGVTTHPGLLGPLITGVNLAKTISLFLKKDIVSVNHIYAHILAITLSHDIEYPFIGLVLSGGHSHFFKVENSYKFTFLGGTIDDAAGEALDKGAKILGLGYPGGHIIDSLAHNGSFKYSFPVTKLDSLNLSYSGIKSSLLRFVQNNKDYKLEDVAASYQKAIFDQIYKKIAIIKKDNIPLVIGGGVAANSYLREITSSFKDIYFVKKEYCTDNAVMVANYAYLNQDHKVKYPNSIDIEVGVAFES